MYIVCYDPETKIPTFTAEENAFVKKEFFEETGHSCFLSEDGNIQNKFVQDDTLVEMKKMDLGDYNTKVKLGEVLEITGIPNPTSLVIDGVYSGIIEDGELEFEPEETGTYKISLSSKPNYLDKIIEVVVV